MKAVARIGTEHLGLERAITDFAIIHDHATQHMGGADARGAGMKLDGLCRQRRGKGIACPGNRQAE